MSELWTPWPSLAAMMTRAKAEGLWFFSPHQKLWFSPAELEKEWEQNRFQWGAVNWQLRSPHEHLAELAAESNEKGQEYIDFAKRMK